MQYDMDLIRIIMLKLYDESPPLLPVADLEIPGAIRQRTADHIDFLAQSKMIHFVAPDNTAESIGLTWKGQSFIGGARHDDFWDEAKKRIGSTFHTASFDEIEEVLMKITDEYRDSLNQTG